MTYRMRKLCACCDSMDLSKVFKLPSTPLANEFVNDIKYGEKQEMFPLALLLCQKCGHLQIEALVDPDRLFRNYLYVAGTSPVTVKHFAEYAQTITDRFLLQKNDLIVEIGSNDGTLLKEFQQLGHKKVVGIDPAHKISQKARDEGVPTITNFFSFKIACDLVDLNGHADIVIANNVFAHAEDLNDIVRGVNVLIGSRGIFVFEVAYLPDVVDNLLFDTIYHEHFSYHTVAPLQKLFARYDMQIFDLEHTPGQLGRGSIRIYAANESAQVHPRVEVAIARETVDGFFNPSKYQIFRERIVNHGKIVRERLLDLKKSGARIAGYGAPAKLTTLMYAFNLDQNVIDFIVDDSPWKQDLYTPGMHIPVFAPTVLHEQKPDFCVIFAWNFADPIIEKHKSYSGKWIVPLPELREV